MTFREEFPDFDPATMPKIPDEWLDVSWHNDACPCFEVLHQSGEISAKFVYVDYAETSQREIENGRRFVVMSHPELGSETLLETDDWNKVLDYIDADRDQP